MNRDQKAAAIAEIADHIDESQAIFAVDYRGISVAQAAELRAKLREADATFKVVKNSLTERAADQAGAEPLKELLAGPTALTFVRGDVATAAKAIADYARATQLLPFKGGLMDGAALDVEQIRSLSRLPSREVLYGQLVGVVASPVSGLVRTLGALLGGLASRSARCARRRSPARSPRASRPPPRSRAAEEPAQRPRRGGVRSGGAGRRARPQREEPPAGEPAAEAGSRRARSPRPRSHRPRRAPMPAPENQAEPEQEPAQDRRQPGGRLG